MGEAAPWSSEVEQRLRENGEPAREPHLRRFLTAVAALGCSTEIPGGQVPNYVNVDPPSGVSGGRMCAITVSSARVQFEGKAMESAERHGLAGSFEVVPSGPFPAIDLTSDRAVADAMLLAAAIVLDRRAASS